MRQTLNRIGNDIRGKRIARGAPSPHIDFPRSRTLHFARLTLLDDPDTGPGRKRLLLATDYGGTWDAHVQELLALTFAPDTIWGCCEGYTSGDDFADFIRSHMVEPQAYYIALPDLGLDQIRRLIQARMQLDKNMFDLPGMSLFADLIRVGSDLARLPFAAVDVLGIVRRHGPLNTLFAARNVNATLDRVWYIRLFNRLTLNGVMPPRHRHSEVPVDTASGCPPATFVDEVMQPDAWDGTPPEDLVSQNQLTLVTVVRPEQLRRLQAVLEVIDLYGRRLTQRGELVGISTIHTVRWALIDGGRRLVLASNYDGPWENYIDEFAELILLGLMQSGEVPMDIRKLARKTWRRSNISCAAIKLPPTSSIAPTQRSLC